MLSEILTGLHACALALSPNGRWLVVANAGSDTLSVIDTRTDCDRGNDLDPAEPRRTCSAPAPTRWRSTRPARRSSSATARRTPWRSFRFAPGRIEAAGPDPRRLVPGRQSSTTPPRKSSVRGQHQGHRLTARTRKSNGRTGSSTRHQYHRHAVAACRVPRRQELAGLTPRLRSGQYALPAAEGGRAAAAARTSRRARSRSAWASPASSSTSSTSSRRTAPTTRCSAT